MESFEVRVKALTKTTEYRRNKALAEWAGWRDFELFPAFMDSLSMKGTVNQESVRAWAFTGSMDACTKWLIPKLFDLNLEYRLYSDDGYHFCQIIFKDRVVANSLGGCETAPEAFCRAIEGLIAQRGNMPRTKGAKTRKPDEARLPIISEFALWLMDKPFPWYRLGSLLSKWEVNRIARQCGKEMIRDLMRVHAQD